ncbi:unnamed protein product [Rangifer tarandus platyrhynchus]|uniref:Uncharacterized protein n=2 Tax=Rangifer tarandus platyrhynchus TaxID=3082113 RepID=A0ACB0F485_RANTA|nr:unnamed protein product [Rangifer tarandus platyrhynchus]CAI9706926.1 unnamed protein product [Rangifer tarandus platyrhynchus]
MSRRKNGPSISAQRLRRLGAPLTVPLPAREFYEFREGCGRGGGPPGADSGARPHPRSGSYGSEPAAAAASAVNKPQARHFRDRPLATANGFPGPVPTANAGGGCRRFRGPASPALPTPAGDRLGDTGFRRRSDLRFPGGRE